MRRRGAESASCSVVSRKMRILESKTERKISVHGKGIPSAAEALGFRRRRKSLKICLKAEIHCHQQTKMKCQHQHDRISRSVFVGKNDGDDFLQWKVSEEVETCMRFN